MLVVANGVVMCAAPHVLLGFYEGEALMVPFCRLESEGGLCPLSQATGQL